MSLGITLAPLPTHHAPLPGGSLTHLDSAPPAATATPVPPPTAPTTPGGAR
jgi:hypothetical protein